MSHNDYRLALLLQQQFEHEASIDNPTNNLSYSKGKITSDKSLVDPSWELIDPTPNIHNLFVAFNEKYFWNKLQAVCVEWSKRMTSCAGICYYNGRGGLCRISLSEPLLKLRPRKDLIQTLLHEMIHAYLFVTDNNKDRDGHGPEFHKHMFRINTQAGTKITVYHDFIDEVQLYQVHWWRCNGPCQQRKPYFGMVRRATNRAPGTYDRWWDEHLRNCGGSFIKVKEPEKPVKITSKVVPSNTINKYFPVLKEKINNHNNSTNSNVVGFNNLKDKTCTATRTNSNGTIVITKKPTQNISKSTTVSKPAPITTIVSTKDQHADNTDYARVRNHWINKYPNNTEHNKRVKLLDENDHNCSIPEKRHKSDDTVACPICRKQFQMDTINSHLDKCIEQPSSLPNSNSKKDIKHNDDKELIPCLVCSKIVLKVDLYVHLDDCMGDDIFISNDNENEADIQTDEIEKVYNCPVCSQLFPVNRMSDHLTICLNNVNAFNEPF